MTMVFAVRDTFNSSFNCSKKRKLDHSMNNLISTCFERSYLYAYDYQNFRGVLTVFTVVVVTSCQDDDSN